MKNKIKELDDANIKAIESAFDEFEKKMINSGELPELTDEELALRDIEGKIQEQDNKRIIRKLENTELERDYESRRAIDEEIRLNESMINKGVAFEKNGVLYNRPTRASFRGVLRKSSLFAIISLLSFIITFSISKIMIQHWAHVGEDMRVLVYTAVVVVMLLFMQRERRFLNIALHGALNEKESIRWGTLFSIYFGVILGIIAVVGAELLTLLIKNAAFSMYIVESIVFAYFTVSLAGSIMSRKYKYKSNYNDIDFTVERESTNIAATDDKMHDKILIDEDELNNSLDKYVLEIDKPSMKLLFAAATTIGASTIMFIVAVFLNILHIELFTKVYLNIIEHPLCLISYLTSVFLFSLLHVKMLKICIFLIEDSLAQPSKGDVSKILSKKDEALLAINLLYLVGVFRSSEANEIKKMKNIKNILDEDNLVKDTKAAEDISEDTVEDTIEDTVSGDVDAVVSKDTEGAKDTKENEHSSESNN